MKKKTRVLNVLYVLLPGSITYLPLVRRVISDVGFAINAGVSHNKEVIEEAQEQLSRVILFEDVSDFLFSLSSVDARLSLVLQFIDFFGGEASHWLVLVASSFSTDNSYSFMSV